MRWARTRGTIQDSDRGYRVVAVRIADRWRYVAWAPTEQPDLSYWDWLMQNGAPITAELNQPIPQRNELISAHDDAEEARGACERHMCRGRDGCDPRKVLRR